jgi:hypothetical protein
MPLVDDSMLDLLENLKFKWFLWNGSNCGDGSEYIPYDKVKVHDIEWKFKLKQNINRNAEGILSKGHKNNEAPKRFDTKQNMNILLQEKIKEKSDIAKRVKDLTSKKKFQPIQLNTPVNPEEVQKQNKPKPQKRSKTSNEFVYCPVCTCTLTVSFKSKKLPTLLTHLTKACAQQYITCQFCKTVVARKNMPAHQKSTCTEIITKWGTWMTDFKKGSELERTHCCEDRVKEKKYKEVIHQNFVLQEQVNGVNKQIKATSEYMQKKKQELIKINAMTKSLSDYIDQNRKNLTDDEYSSDATSSTQPIPKKTKKLVYQEGFAYRKEHSWKVFHHWVLNKGSDQFLTADQTGVVKLWGLDKKVSIATFDVVRMTQTLYPISALAKARDSQNSEKGYVYKLECMTQWQSTNLVFVIGIYTQEDRIVRSIFLAIQQDYAERQKSLNVETLPKFYDVNEFMENEEKNQ